MLCIAHGKQVATTMTKRNQQSDGERRVAPIKGRAAYGAYHVQPAKKGGWEVRREGSSRATGQFTTKAEAVSRAKEVSRSSGFELKIHARDGRIRETIPSIVEADDKVSNTHKSERIEIRTTREMKALLQRAATFSHKNVTEFLLEAGIHAAEEALVDRRMFRLDDAQWQAFQDVLDRPVQSKPRLAKLLAEKSVLE